MKTLAVIIAMAISTVFLSNTVFAVDVPQKESAQPAKASPVTAAEDLMREHGLLERALLIYTFALSEHAHNRPMPLTDLNTAADIVKRFVEDYHEKLEEEYVFPVLEKRSQLPDIIPALRTQHDRGRAITTRILKLTQSKELDKAQADSLRRDLYEYIRMYRPHYAREDTVVFPRFHEILSAREYADIGEKFEAREKELFGEKGFESMLDKVAAVEKRLDIHDLQKFTPPEKDLPPQR